MWVYYMREALRDRPQHQLPMPEGVVTARVSAVTGEPAAPGDPDSAFEYFLAGHVPGRGVPGSTRDSAAPPASPRPEEPIS